MPWSSLTSSGLLQVRPPSSENTRKMSVLVVGFVAPVIGDVEIADERSVDPALIRAVRPQRVVLGEDQARADPVGRGRRGGRVSVSQRADRPRS